MPCSSPSPTSSPERISCRTSGLLPRPAAEHHGAQISRAPSRTRSRSLPTHWPAAVRPASTRHGDHRGLRRRCLLCFRSTRQPPDPNPGVARRQSVVPVPAEPADDLCFLFFEQECSSPSPMWPLSRGGRQSRRLR
uniref:Uncharacterized protein n=1 Tax=Triticum urartu TaxID=4572 RepID=A0A8R7TIG4_TRIUA